jgi:hypothetical protein
MCRAVGTLIGDGGRSMLAVRVDMVGLPPTGDRARLGATYTCSIGSPLPGHERFGAAFSGAIQAVSWSIAL